MHKKWIQKNNFFLHHLFLTILCKPLRKAVVVMNANVDYPENNVN